MDKSKKRDGAFDKTKKQRRVFTLWSLLAANKGHTVEFSGQSIAQL